MKVLVVGGGGREHALVWALSKSPKVNELYCAPGNGGIAQLATCVDLKATDVDGIVAWASANAMDFVVVAPDDPLALGMVDALEAAGIPAFGPRRNAAVIEASKSFSKQLMAQYHIPTAACQVFTERDAALDYVRSQPLPIVIKADGLALGKGVIIADTLAEAVEAVEDMLDGGKFGDAGRKIVIEAYMTGPEVTVLAFCDGTHLVPMPSSRDHKRALNGDQGPNTGGMGAISPAPGYTGQMAGRCMREIFLPTVAAMAAEGRPFQGVLYFGLMLTPEGPKVVEYNARFGDPECQAVLSLLDSDLLEILLACRSGTLDQVDIRWKDAASCCLVLASGGYPGAYGKGYPISGLEEAGRTATVFHAGTARTPEGEVVTSGGRVLGVTAVAGTLEEAIDRAYQSAAGISFTNRYCRDDIGRTSPN